MGGSVRESVGGAVGGAVAEVVGAAKLIINVYK